MIQENVDVGAYSNVENIVRKLLGMFSPNSLYPACFYEFSC